VFDLEGSGATDAQSAADLERELDARLQLQWGPHAKAVVIAPEVDAWVWGADNTLRECLHWPLQGSIRDWLRGRGFAFDAHGKPTRPKEAMEALVPVHRLPRSSALYEKITGKISLHRCVDPAFLRLRATLAGWFPAVD
jgi:hypothetical protein